MALPFLNGSGRKRDQMIAVDLGTRTTKAVWVERRGEVVTLHRYAMLDAPTYDKKFSPEVLAEHLKAVAANLGARTKNLGLAVGLDDAIVKQVELPQIPMDEMRLVLKTNSKAYLQQDLPKHVFDCHIFPPKFSPPGKDAGKAPGIPKLKVLVAGSKQQLVEDYQSAANQSGLNAELITPGLVAPVNAFEIGVPKAFTDESVALVDIGFKHSSICILDRGELILTRVVGIGGDKITAGIAEAMSITYPEAEGIKVGMSSEVQSAIESQVIPLGRELRASLDFYENQHDRAISQIYVSGGSAQSELILQTLQSELGAECKTWSATAALQIALPGQQAVEIEHVGSQLSVAIGTALAAL